MRTKHPLLPYPRLLLLILLFTLPFSHPASITPPTPVISNLSLALPRLLSPFLTAGRDLECFNLTTPKAHPVNTADCPPAIDLLYHDPTGIMTLQQFSRSRFLHPLAFHVPFAWHFGSCQVLLTSGGNQAFDTFRLADVVVKAMRIIEQCPPLSKKSLGGLALVGNGETFFVAINGPDLSPDVEGGGEGGGSGDVVGLELEGDGEEEGGAVVDPDLAREWLMAS